MRKAEEEIKAIIEASNKELDKLCEDLQYRVNNVKTLVNEINKYTPFKPKTK